ncbi:unnamed protein product [Blepharisma stoltei]|uniref:Phosphoglycerate mutase n=1 Tax=Blepharisma stoltei TaxID=1481888 RepID=A0AAU9IE64_9CILI|nr:unnamed protein product [Blepharisma stoltei]
MSKGLKVYFIRHAESYNNYMKLTHRESYESYREIDPVLTSVGQDQATKLGEYMKKNWKNFEIQCVYTSPMIRTLQTAKFAFDGIDAKREVWTDIYEVRGPRRNGVPFPGSTRSQLLKMFPEFEIPNEVNENGWFFKETVETLEEAETRAKNLWNRLIGYANNKEYPFTSIALITHGKFLNFLFYFLLKEWIYKGNAFFEPLLNFYNTGVSQVILRKDLTLLESMDKVGHLPVPPRHKGGYN